ncbi:MAG TPA: DinB family protein [Holophagaceae bacterium]|nr:DinB family protein [Holophagaceae bacterium]
MLELVQDLYRHMEWADARHWSAVRANAAAWEDAELKERLIHIHAVQHLWLARWQGVAITVPQASDYAGMEDLLHFAKACHAALRAFLSMRQEADLAADVAYKSLAGEPFTQPLGDLMLHLAFHTQYHRGQSATRMRALGGQMPATDLVVWQREGRPVASWE